MYQISPATHAIINEDTQTLISNPRFQAILLACFDYNPFELFKGCETFGEIESTLIASILDPSEDDDGSRGYYFVARTDYEINNTLQKFKNKVQTLTILPPPSKRLRSSNLRHNDYGRRYCRCVLFTVSAITQLTMAANQSSPKGHSADDRISFWFKACACGLFGGNGLVWVLDAADQIECRAVDMEAVTSTVAILSALAFVAALQRFFLSTAMLSASASIILIAAHGAFSITFAAHFCDARERRYFIHGHPHIYAVAPGCRDARLYGCLLVVGHEPG